MSRKGEAGCEVNLVLRLSESGEDDILPSRSISVIGTSQSWQTTRQRVERFQTDKRKRQKEQGPSTQCLELQVWIKEVYVQRTEAWRR